MGATEEHTLTVKSKPPEAKLFSATFTLKKNPYIFPSSPNYPSYCPREPHFGYGDGIDAGHAFHLGTFAGREEFCFDLRPTKPPEKILGWGHHIWKAANGDELYINYSFYLGPFPPSPPPPNSFMGGTFEITGGTGRFSKATGGGTCTGYQKPDETSDFCYEGWIDY